MLNTKKIKEIRIITCNYFKSHVKYKKKFKKNPNIQRLNFVFIFSRLKQNEDNMFNAVL